MKLGGKLIVTGIFFHAARARALERLILHAIFTTPQRKTAPNYCVIYFRGAKKIISIFLGGAAAQLCSLDNSCMKIIYFTNEND